MKKWRMIMENPFISYTGTDAPYLTDICSINKLVLKKLPFKEIVGDIEGLKAGEVFSTKVIGDMIRSNSKALGLNESEYTNSSLAKELEKCLYSQDEDIKAKAEEIFKIFGYRLGVIFIVLKQGYIDNRLARPGWSEIHWEYWRQLKRVILVGGLTNGRSGQLLKKYALEAFSIAGEAPYEFLLFENASHYGTLGCATLVRDKSRPAIVFDFGQTNVKRCIVDFYDNKVSSENFLESVPSLYMEWRCISENEKLELAKMLHKRIVGIIADTYREAKNNKNIGNEIIIGIASYTVEGYLHDARGGYAKLTLLADNYGSFLEEELIKELNEKVSISLVHDGSAVALYFNEYKEAVCVSLGTAFGVGFPC